MLSKCRYFCVMKLLWAYAIVRRFVFALFVLYGINAVPVNCQIAFPFIGFNARRSHWTTQNEPSDDTRLARISFRVGEETSFCWGCPPFHKIFTFFHGNATLRCSFARYWATFRPIILYYFAKLKWYHNTWSWAKAIKAYKKDCKKNHCTLLENVHQTNRLISPRT